METVLKLLKDELTVWEEQRENCKKFWDNHLLMTSPKSIAQRDLSLKESELHIKELKQAISLISKQ